MLVSSCFILIIYNIMIYYAYEDIQSICPFFTPIQGQILIGYPQTHSILWLTPPASPPEAITAFTPGSVLTVISVNAFAAFSCNVPEIKHSSSSSQQSAATEETTSSSSSSSSRDMDGEGCVLARE
eukprot:COSAG06_NODE_4136_length_4535_cov_7.572813_7_plen_126_part_00